jgi:hypothetical protein
MRRFVLFASAAALCACSTNVGKVQGNESGGIIPDTIKSEPEQVQAAKDFCAQYGKVSRVTARPGEASGRLIFVCESTPPPAPPLPPPTGPSRKK